MQWRGSAHMPQAMAAVVLVICEPPLRAALRVACPTVDDEDHRRPAQRTLSLPSPLPEWLRRECEASGLQPPCTESAGESIIQTGVLALGLLRLSQRGLSVYRGSLTNWPQHSSLLWEVYHRPVDAMSVRVAQAWRFQAPVALHHRSAQRSALCQIHEQIQWACLACWDRATVRPTP